jgi:hypothetical protein
MTSRQTPQLARAVATLARRGDCDERAMIRGRVTTDADRRAEERQLRVGRAGREREHDLVARGRERAERGQKSGPPS